MSKKKQNKCPTCGAIKFNIKSADNVVEVNIAEDLNIITITANKNHFGFVSNEGEIKEQGE